MGEENHGVHVLEEDGVSKKGGLSKLQVSNTAAQEVKTHACRECNKVFSSGKALGGHMSIVHSRCKKNSSSKKRIKNEQSAEFKCRWCDMGFPSKKAVDGHMKVHSDRNLTRVTAPTKSKVPVDSTKSLKSCNATDDGKGSPDTKSVVDEFPDLWNLAHSAAMDMDDHENFEVNVGHVSNFPGDYESESEDSMTTSAYYCPDCPLVNISLDSSLEADACSKEPESTIFTEEPGLGEKLPAGSKSRCHEIETFMQSSPVDWLEGTRCVEVKKLTGKKLKKRHPNLLEKTKTKKKKKTDI